MLSRSITIASLILMSGCKPLDRGSELDPDAPIMTFKFTVTPASKAIDIGDTLIFESVAPSTLSNGETLTDGEAYHFFSFTYDSSSIITEPGHSKHAVENDDFFIVKEYGSVTYNSVLPGAIWKLNSIYNTGIFRFKYKLVLKRRGVFDFILRSGIVTSSKGRIGTDAYFDMPNLHWDLIQVPGADTPQIGSLGYNGNYHVRVQ